MVFGSVAKADLFGTRAQLVKVGRTGEVLIMQDLLRINHGMMCGNS